MSDFTKSYMNFYTYEYIIISKLNFERIGDELVNSSLMWEDEREKISNIISPRKQNLALVKYLQDERRGFYPFLDIVVRDSSYTQHAELARTIIARSSSKSEEQIDDNEIYQGIRNDSCSDSDSSAFTYETQRFSDINSPDWYDRKTESEFGGSEVERRSVTSQGSFNFPQPIQVSNNKQIQRKRGWFSILLFLFLIAFSILNMPLKFGYRCSKLIFMT
ncbi:hypothetical protein LOD99_1921 [Oopsacas minuta]|uniref:Uncharacterized protein n=1 Tax=Oopsacas minuta TaxID=111878 RepID=A0AAV7K4Y5_9METZ|nr:hypothetical protein LOD99_1921 [Oopsacas minuta]